MLPTSSAMYTTLNRSGLVRRQSVCSTPTRQPWVISPPNKRGGQESFRRLGKKNTPDAKHLGAGCRTTMHDASFTDWQHYRRHNLHLSMCKMELLSFCGKNDENDSFVVSTHPKHISRESSSRVHEKYWKAPSIYKNLLHIHLYPLWSVNSSLSPKDGWYVIKCLYAIPCN